MTSQPGSLKRPLVENKRWQIIPKHWRFLLVIVLIIGIFFRFTHLDQKVFWFDESATMLKISGDTAQVWSNRLPSNKLIGTEDVPKYFLPNPESNIFDTIKLLAKQDAKHAPLYFVMLRFWVDLFGNSLAAMRSLSAIISLLVFPSIYWLCVELFKKPKVGLTSVALAAVSPFHILYAQEARMYSLQMVVVLLSSAVLLRAIRINSKQSWGIYTLSLLLSIYTHTITLFVALAHGIYIVAAYGFRQTKITRNYLFASFISLLGFAPWLYFIITNSEQVKSSMDWSTKAIPLSSLMTHWVINLSRVFIDFNPSYRLNEFSSFNNPFSIFYIGAILILVGYSIYFIIRNSHRRTWILVLSLIGIPFLALALPDMLFNGIRSFNNRYLVASYLGIQLGVAYLLATKMVFAAKLWQQKSWQILTITLIGFSIVSCAIISTAETWWNKYYSSDIIPMTKIVNQSSQPLLIVEKYWRSGWNLYSINNFLESKVKIKPLIEGNMTNEISDKFSNIYVFNPSTKLKTKLRNSQKYEIQPVYNGESFEMMEVKIN
ncbi:MAG: glycosyltransferase family 39 protein [Cyanobacteria bacterium J06643_5]